MTRWLVWLVVLWVLPAGASAQLAEGRRRLEEADFEGAIVALDLAEQEDGLTREDVIAIFEARAIARRATGDVAGAREDLQRLASLDPAHVFPAEAPPELADELAEVASAAPLEIVVEWEDEASDRVTVDARITGDSTGLVTDVVIWTRSGPSPWRRSTGSSATVDVRTSSGQVQGYVEALGPGGAVIATVGSRESPLLHRIGVVDTPTTPATPGGPADDTLLHIGLAAGGGGLALVIVIVVAAVVGSQPSNQTRLEGPIIVGF